MNGALWIEKKERKFHRRPYVSHICRFPTILMAWLKVSIKPNYECNMYCLMECENVKSLHGLAKFWQFSLFFFRFFFSFSAFHSFVSLLLAHRLLCVILSNFISFYLFFHAREYFLLRNSFVQWIHETKQKTKKKTTKYNAKNKIHIILSFKPLVGWLFFSPSKFCHFTGISSV